MLIRDCEDFFFLFQKRYCFVDTQLISVCDVKDEIFVNEIILHNSGRHGI